MEEDELPSTVISESAGVISSTSAVETYSNKPASSRSKSPNVLAAESAIQEIVEAVVQKSVPSLSISNIDQETIDRVNSNDTNTKLENEDDPMNSVESPNKKVKKRRLPSILKSLEMVDMDNLVDNNQDDDLPRYQSSRAAAIVAKTKLNVNTNKHGSGIRSASQDDLSTKDNNMKEKSAREKDKDNTDKDKDDSTAENKKGNKDLNAKPKRPAGRPQKVELNLQWVECDKCHKWRCLGPDRDITALPEHWDCTMAQWNLVTNENTCEVAEESEDHAKAYHGAVKAGDMELFRRWEAAEAQRQLNASDSQQEGNSKDDATPVVKTPAGKPGRGKGRGNYTRRAPTAASYDDTNNDSDDDKDNDSEVKPSAVKGKRQVSRNSLSRDSTAQMLANGSQDGYNQAGTGIAMKMDWVQCNTCKKWRTVPEGIDVQSLPERWYCYMNGWNPATSKCSAKQEDDSVYYAYAGNIGNTTTANYANRFSTRGRRALGPPQAGIGALPSVNGAPVAVKKTSWVQCERKTCKKWRKVPAHIDPDTFPEKWYCEMTTWNHDAANCDAPQDSDSDDDRQRGASARNSLITGNAKGPAVLSYRRIIFANDGKIRACFSDKNKVGNGLFSYAIPQRPMHRYGLDGMDGDQFAMLEPVRRVSYWWSSAYSDRALVTPVAVPTAVGTGTEQQQLNSLDSQQSSTTSAVTAEPAYMLDMARRMYGMDSSSPTRSSGLHSPYQIKAKAIELVMQATLFQRMEAENVAVRSALLSAACPLVLVSQLEEVLHTCHLIDPLAEACRQCSSHQTVLDTLHRLEDKGEVEVLYTAHNQLVVSMLRPLEEMKRDLASRREKFDRVYNADINGSKLYNPRNRKCFRRPVKGGGNGHSVSQSQQQQQQRQEMDEGDGDDENEGEEQS